MADSSIATTPDLPKPPPELAPEAIAPPEDESNWPKTIGVLSIIYALGGLLCNAGYGGFSIFLESLMKMQGAELSVPIAAKAAMLLPVVLNLILGIVLLTGAIKLLRQRRSGVALIQRWAVGQLATLLLAVVLIVATAPTQIELARARSMAGENAGAAPSDETLYRNVLIQTSILTGVLAVYPLVIGFYLSRRKIHRQTQHWPSR